MFLSFIHIDRSYYKKSFTSRPNTPLFIEVDNIIIVFIHNIFISSFLEFLRKIEPFSSSYQSGAYRPGTGATGATGATGTSGTSYTSSTYKYEKK